MLSVRMSFAWDAADCGRRPRRHCPLFVLSPETFNGSSASVGLINLSAAGFLRAARCCCSSHHSWKDIWWSFTPVRFSVFSVTSPAVEPLLEHAHCPLEHLLTFGVWTRCLRQENAERLKLWLSAYWGRVRRGNCGLV